jgi:DNA-binding MarR family transcriptional regulator
VTETVTLTPEEWSFWDSWTHAQRLFTEEVERGLQRDVGISKAEFSVLVTLHRELDRQLRVSDLASSLAWDKSRASHLLTRMESRGLVTRAETGVSGRRTGISMTAKGRQATDRALRVHAANIRRFFLDTLTPDQAAAIKAWSEQTVDRLEPKEAEAATSSAS